MTSSPDLLRWLEEEEVRTNGELWRLSQKIWTEPELKFQEHKAHQVLTDYLEEKGFNVQRHYILPTAFRAEFSLSSSAPEVGAQSPSGPTIGILCEYDALPDIGHACGHNLIAEVGIATALAMKQDLLSSKINAGKLVVLGTPAEEDGGGKIRLLNDGAFQGMDAVLMAHPYHGPDFHFTPTGLTALKVGVKFLGRAAHSTGRPWQGLNALDAAVTCYVSVGLLKQQLKPDCKINGVITEGGQAANVIPQQAVLRFFIRASNSKNCTELLGRFQKCVSGAADATGCQAECDIEWDTYYVDIVQNKAIVDRYRFHTQALGIQYNPDLVMNASTDFGNVSHVIPGIHPCFGLGTDFFPHTAGFADKAGSREAQGPTLKAAAALAATGADLMKDPELLEAVRQRHQEVTQSEL